MQTQIEAVKAPFLRAAERMADLPVYNPKLEVDFIGYQPLNSYRMGVLITPWCMNLLLLPDNKDQWSADEIGETQIIELPSGRYDFIRHWDPSLGGYLSCSLFSPMAEFEDQPAAVAVAEEVIRAVVDKDHVALTDRQRELSTKEEQENRTAPSGSVRRSSPSEGVSRRGFLTATWADRR